MTGNGWIFLMKKIYFFIHTHYYTQTVSKIDSTKDVCDVMGFPHKHPQFHEDINFTLSNVTLAEKMRRDDVFARY